VTLESPSLAPVARLSRFIALSAMLMVATAAFAKDDGLPPRSEWKTSGSSKQVAALAPELAIDGDMTTHWGGAFSADHWLQLDMGRAAEVGGVLLNWDYGFAVSYAIQTSLDGKAWKDAYISGDSRGFTDYLFFPKVKARYLRLASLPKTADWGVSVREFEPLSARDAAHLSGLAGTADPNQIWSGTTPRALQAAGKQPGTRTLDIALGRALPVAGLEVWWGGPRDGAKLEGREVSGQWIPMGEDPGSLGDLSYLAAPEVHTIDALRMTVGESGGAPVLKRLRLLGPERVMTATKRQEIAASRTNSSLFPSSLHQQQVYWTAVGIPAGMQKSIFDEYGNLEPYKGSPMVQAVWRDAGGRAVIADNVERKHSLREDWMPIPTVE